MEVKARTGANSGFYFHTAFQEKDWPAEGFEVQVDNSQERHGDYLELKMTGQPLRHPQRLQGAGEGRRVVHAARHGAQAPRPDPGERHARRRLDRAAGPAPRGRPEGEPPRPRHVRPPVPRPGEQGLLPQPPGEAPAALRRPVAGAPAPRRRALRADARPRRATNFPLVDLHAHLKGGLTIDQVLALSRGTGMFLGVAVNCGKGFPIQTDADALAWVESMKGQPVFVGMQAEGREWVTMFSRETRGAVRLRLHRLDDLDEPRRQAHAALGSPRRSRSDPTSRPSWTCSSRRRSGSSRRSRSTSTSTRRSCPAVIASRYDELWTEERMTQVDRRRGQERRRDRDQRPLQDPERALPPSREGEGREVHVRHEQRRGERPRRLVVPAGDAEGARPDVEGHVRPRPPAEPRAEGLIARRPRAWARGVESGPT